MKLNKKMPVRISLIVILCLGMVQLGMAQRPSRSFGSQMGLKSQSDPVDLPCAGVTVLAEDFENGMPAGWLIVDGDGFAPRTELNLQAGWQLRSDYDDTSNTVMVSPSWYQGGGASNDWLILPQVSLGANPCMSWSAYSLDNFFLENYEIRVSTSTSDTSDFLSLGTADVVSEERSNKTIRAISLADYANQSVFIAFRQISDDEFALILDDVRISNIQPLDIGVSDITYGSPDPGDSIRFTFKVSNYGADTVTSFTACWSVNGGASNCMLVDTFVLPPNQTLSFAHTDTFVSDSLDAFYDLCAWTAAPNSAGDNDAGNDTTCLKMAVGSPVGIENEFAQGFDLVVYPNPVSGESVHLAFSKMESPQRVEVRLIDLSGALRLTRSFTAYQGAIQSIPSNGLAKGLYFLEVRGEKGSSTYKITVQ